MTEFAHNSHTGIPEELSQKVPALPGRWPGFLVEAKAINQSIEEHLVSVAEWADKGPIPMDLWNKITWVATRLTRLFITYGYADELEAFPGGMLTASNREWRQRLIEAPLVTEALAKTHHALSQVLQAAEEFRKATFSAVQEGIGATPEGITPNGDLAPVVADSEPPQQTNTQEPPSGSAPDNHTDDAPLTAHEQDAIKAHKLTSKLKWEAMAKDMGVSPRSLRIAVKGEPVSYGVSWKIIRYLEGLAIKPA